MLFSILIANFNNGQYFKDCYESIIVQTYKDWEVIIVDDASTDDSVNVIKEIIGIDARFRIYENATNRGCGFSKRKCVEMAEGQLCGFLDPDDAITPEALEEMVLAHSGNDYAAVHSNFIFCDENLKLDYSYHLAKGVTVNDKFTNLNNAVTAFTSFKKAFYKRTIGISPNLKRAVDQDLYLKLAETGPFYFLNKALYLYRIHANGIASNNEGKALYCHLKVIYEAEKRRGVDLEEEVAIYLKKKVQDSNTDSQDNLGYTWLQFKTSFKKRVYSKFHKLFNK